MNAIDWAVFAVAILASGLIIAGAWVAREWLEKRKYRLREKALLAAWRQWPRGGPLDGAGLITDEDEEILAGIKEATDRRPGQ